MFNEKSLFSVKYNVVFDVKFEDKEKAKALRLRWNPSMKKWAREIECNGLTDQAIIELDNLPIKVFKITDIQSDWLCKAHGQKKELLKYCQKVYMKAHQENEESTQEREAELKWLAKRRPTTVAATSHEPVIDFK